MSHMDSKKSQVYTGRIPTMALPHPFHIPFNVLVTTGVNMAFLTVAAVSALCLLLPVTRVYGVIGAGILLYFFPFLTLGILLTGGAIFFYFHK